jgi:hypothetical protein
MESKITTEMTAIMREADQAFETVGGSTRHYVRDVLLPLMEQKGYAIVKKDERQPASRIPLTPGAPTTTGTYFASIRSFAGYTDEMVVLHHQADKGVYYAYGQFSRPVKAEDIIGHVAREGHGMGEAYDELRASHRLMSRAYADALIERDEAKAQQGMRRVKASEFKSEKTTFRPYRRKSDHEGVDYDFGEVFIEVSEDYGRIYLEVGDNNYQHQSNIIWANYEILEESAAPAAVSQDAHEKEIMMQAFARVRQIFEGRQWVMDGRGSQDEMINFSEWAATIAFFDDGTRLWELMGEGESINGQFRFTTKEFIEVYKNQHP